MCSFYQFNFVIFFIDRTDLFQKTSTGHCEILQLHKNIPQLRQPNLLSLLLCVHVTVHVTPFVESFL